MDGQEKEWKEWKATEQAAHLARIRARIRDGVWALLKTARYVDIGIRWNARYKRTRLCQNPTKPAQRFNHGNICEETVLNLAERNLETLHQQLDVPLFKQVLATALERAIERADFNR